MPNACRPDLVRPASDAPGWLVRLLWTLPGLAAAALCAALSCGGPLPEAIRVVGAAGGLPRAAHPGSGVARGQRLVRVDDPAAIDVVRTRRPSAPRPVAGPSPGWASQGR